MDRQTYDTMQAELADVWNAYAKRANAVRPKGVGTWVGDHGEVREMERVFANLHHVLGDTILPVDALAAVVAAAYHAKTDDLVDHRAVSSGELASLLATQAWSPTKIPSGSPTMIVLDHIYRVLNGMRDLPDGEDDIWSNRSVMPRSPRSVTAQAKFESISDPVVELVHVRDEVGSDGDPWHFLLMKFSVPRDIAFGIETNTLAITLADRSDGTAGMLASALIWMALHLLDDPTQARVLADLAAAPGRSFPGFDIAISALPPSIFDDSYVHDPDADPFADDLDPPEPSA